MFVLRSTYDAMKRQRDDEKQMADKLALELSRMRDELRQSWQRNARGHLVRHPSYTGPAK